MELLYPLVELLPRQCAGSRRRRESGPLSKSVRVREELPSLVSAIARIQRIDDATTHVTVPAEHATMVDTIVALADGGDLSTEEWLAVDARALVAAAEFFKVPDVRRLVELVHHRTSVARTAPDIARAIAIDSAARAAIRRGETAESVLSVLSVREIPLGTRTARATRLPGPEVPLFIRAQSKPSGDDIAWPSAETVIDALQRVHVYAILRKHKDNVVVGGGFVASTLIPSMSPVADQDVDLFMWGCDEDTATDIVADIVRSLRNTCANIKLFSSAQAFTISVTTPHVAALREPEVVTRIQIVRRIYSSVGEIPLGFDVPASAVVFKVVTLAENGTTRDTVAAYGTASFFAAAETGAVWIDPERQSASYAWRILKYWARGFNVLLLGMNRRIANMSVVNAPLRDLHGLSEILAIEHMASIRHLDRTQSPYRTLRLVSIVRRGLPTSDYDDTIVTSNLDDAVRFPASQYTHPNLQRIRVDLDVNEAIDEYTWKTRAPGEQVTSTFKPGREPFYTGAITRPYETQ